MKTTIPELTELDYDAWFHVLMQQNIDVIKNLIQLGIDVNVSDGG